MNAKINRPSRVEVKKCGPKVPYATFDDAKAMARILVIRRGAALSAYQCRVCGHWHLTSKLS